MAITMILASPLILWTLFLAYTALLAQWHVWILGHELKHCFDGAWHEVAR